MSNRSQFIQGFVKAAIAANAPSLKLAGPAPSPAPSSPPMAPKPAAPLPPAQAAPLPNPHAGWQLKGYSGGTGAPMSYTYQTPGGGFEHTNSPIDQGSLQSFNKQTNANPWRSAPPAPPQSSASQMEDGLRRASRMPQGSSPYAMPGYGMQVPSEHANNPQDLAKDIGNDDMASRVVARLDPKLFSQNGHNTPPPTYDAERRGLYQNITQNPELRTMLDQVNPQIANELGNSDPGLQQDGVRQMNLWLDNLAQTNPQLAQQIMQKFLGHSTPPPPQ